MISLIDRASFDDAAFLCRETGLQRLLLSRIAALVRDGHDLTDLTQILIVQAGDSEADIIEEIGLSPLVNPLDGCRYGDPQFHPWWDWLQETNSWFEMVITVGNAGFAFVLLIQDDDGVCPDLLAMCREYAR